jgi:ribosomal-protein-serine acetyltransferase
LRGAGGAGLIHAGFLRGGLATTAARLLTDAACTVDGIERIEVHHDEANIVSAGAPQPLGFVRGAE